MQIARVRHILQTAHSVLPFGALHTRAYLEHSSLQQCLCSLCAAEEERWRRWVDDRLARVITINIYRSAKESFQTFEYITEYGNFN